MWPLVVAAVIAVLLWLLNLPWRSGPFRRRFAQQSTIIPTRALTEGDVYRSAEGEGKELLSRPFPEVATLHDVFLRGLKVNPNGKCLGRRVEGGGRKFVFETYTEVYQRITDVGSALVGIGAKRGDMIAIYAPNCPEWVVANRACNAQSLVTVPLYDTLGLDASKFILVQTEAKIVFVGERQLALLAAFVAGCPHVKTIIVIGNPAKLDVKMPGTARVVSFSDFQAEGAKAPVACSPPQPEDIATLCYTSGTTGDPKGALIAHRALVANLAGANARLGEAHALGPKDSHLSYLPLAHMFERLVNELCCCAGAAIGFYRGDTSKIFDDIGALQPTVFVSVPRIYSRLADGIRDSVEKGGFISRTLFNFALWTKRQNLRFNITGHWLWDRVVFARVRASIGGRVRLLVSGAAPLPDAVTSFLRCTFSCTVLEGYGQTECGAAATVTTPGDCCVGHVGPPLQSVEIKLVDVPEMMYFSKDLPRPRGEICFRGPSLFSGYFKSASENPIDKNGWLHSGDIGQWNANGTLSIIDRRKNIFKLSQGEYVAPDRVEGVYGRSSFISQIFVTGNSHEASLVAVIVPNEDKALAFARENGLRADNLDQLCRHHTFKEAVVFDMRRLAAEAGLKGFETVANVHLTPVAFSIENGLLTPTLKIKRPVAQRVFQREISDMYQTKKG